MSTEENLSCLIDVLRSLDDKSISVLYGECGEVLQIKKEKGGIIFYDNGKEKTMQEILNNPEIRKGIDAECRSNGYVKFISSINRMQDLVNKTGQPFRLEMKDVMGDECYTGQYYEILPGQNGQSNIRDQDGNTLTADEIASAIVKAQKGNRKPGQKVASMALNKATNYVDRWGQKLIAAAEGR